MWFAEQPSIEEVAIGCRTPRLHPIREKVSGRLLFAHNRLEICGRSNWLGSARDDRVYHSCFIGGHIFAATKAEMDDVKAKYQAVGKDFDKVMTSAKAGVTATVNFVEAIQKLSAAKSANTEVVGLMRQGVELAYELLVANLHNKQADLTREAVIARKDGSTARLQGVSVE